LSSRGVRIKRPQQRITGCGHVSPSQEASVVE
jgi:hypothetical protein